MEKDNFLYDWYASGSVNEVVSDTGAADDIGGDVQERCENPQRDPDTADNSPSVLLRED
ncbi:hypothetical protein QJS10_CPA03g01384 [Acorus calamus]|uniref:Uncharacterized protein n=1 Tax=Acorus calamus TaxID=4465 RepID=A0AAV9F4P7_ACOCL|nr:hypothetical protein QJS10_CPA03g01384 [Acorus calamus]